MTWKQIVINRWRRIAGVQLGLVAVLLLVPAVALAAQSNSTNYQVNEVFFGSGGELNACSANYCTKQSAGDLAAGNTASTNYQAQAGFNTDRYPYIEFNVSNTNVDLGILTASTTKTATSIFSVKAYLSSGYSVINASDGPTNNSYGLKTLTTPTATSVGTEQFGINLAANTSPVSFGANPTQNPDSSFASGVVAAGYNTANAYKYVKGDTIASSSASTSNTNYTVSYLFNISPVTPGGTYVMRHVLVATGTY